MSRHKSLIAACQNGNRHACEYILKNYNVDPSANDNEALLKACQSGEYSLVKLLLQDKRVQSRSIGAALQWTSRHCHFLKSEQFSVNLFPDIFELLFQFLVIDDAFLRDEPLCWASVHGHAQLVKKLLDEDRVDPAQRDNYAIIHASYHGCAEIVRLLLLDNRVDPAARNNIALELAAGENHWSIVGMLISDIRVNSMSRHMPVLDNISLIKSRAGMICIALQELDLPALQTVEILDALFPTNRVSMYKKWQLVTLIKHFKD